MAKTLEDYLYDKRQVEIKIANRVAKNAKIEQEIARLENAYNKMGKIKRENLNNAVLVINNTKPNKIVGKVKWRGEYKDKFDAALKEEAYRAAREFYCSIDNMQDEIGIALDKKRGEYDTGYSLLNGLKKSLYKISGYIRNLSN